jgi:hypothetical protein
MGGDLMKKQTAVEWLALYIKGITNLNCDEVIDQAKAMEKEQIIDAYLQKRGKRSITGVLNCMDEAYQYYTETYEL